MLQIGRFLYSFKENNNNKNTMMIIQIVVFSIKLNINNPKDAGVVLNLNKQTNFLCFFFLI